MAEGETPVAPVATGGGGAVKIVLVLVVLAVVGLVVFGIYLNAKDKNQTAEQAISSFFDKVDKNVFSKDNPKTTSLEKEPIVEPEKVKETVEKVTKDAKEAKEKVTRTVEADVDAVSGATHVEVVKPKSKTNWWMIGIIALLVLGLSGGGFWWWKKRNPKKKNPKYDPTPPSDIKYVDQPDPIQPHEKPYTPKKPIPKPEERVTIDLSPHFTKVKNQQSLGSCAAFAGASVLEYVMNKSGGNRFSGKPDLSELFLYYYGRVDKSRDSGSRRSDICQAMQDKGVCVEKFWDYTGYQTKYLEEPNQVAQDDATKQMLVEHWYVQNQKDDIIGSLNDGFPLLVGIQCPSDFSGKYYGKIGGSMRGGHAMVIVGYKSHYTTPKQIETQAFKVRNSWGSGWGDNGYIWVQADLMITLMDRMGPPRILTGWKSGKKNKKLPVKIEGKIIYDFKDHNVEINEFSGAKLSAEKSLKELDHKVTVGVLGQVNGQIKKLAEVKDVSAYFMIRFDLKDELEPLTQLASTEKDFKGIADMNSLGPGLVVFKQGEDGVKYFHIVNINQSKLGRGGHGHVDRTNPRSDISKHLLGYGKSISGIPIQFSKTHKSEINVIIPVFGVTVEYENFEIKKEKLLNHLEKVNGMMMDTFSNMYEKATPQKQKLLKAFEEKEIFKLKDGSLAWIFEKKNVEQAKKFQEHLKNVRNFKQSQLDGLNHLWKLNDEDRVLISSLIHKLKSEEEYLSKLRTDFHKNIQGLAKKNISQNIAYDSSLDSKKIRDLSIADEVDKQLITFIYQTIGPLLHRGIQLNKLQQLNLEQQGRPITYLIDSINNVVEQQKSGKGVHLEENLNELISSAMNTLHENLEEERKIDADIKVYLDHMKQAIKLLKKKNSEQKEAK